MVMVAIASCEAPSDGYLLVRKPPVSPDCGFQFEASLTDTLASYSTFIATRIITSKYNRRDSSLVLDIVVKSPAGDISAERISLPMMEIRDKVIVDRGGTGTIDMEWPYRNNIKVHGKQAGKWQIFIQPAMRESLGYLAGFGFSYRK